MNKSNLIALALAADFREQERNANNGVLVTHDSSYIDYLRDKEGKNATKPTSKSLVKIGKALAKKHNLLMSVGIVPTLKKTKEFQITLFRIQQSSGPSGTGVHASLTHVTPSNRVKGDSSDSVTSLYRTVRNLRGKKLKSSEKKECEQAIATLEDRAGTNRGSGEVLAAA